MAEDHSYEAILRRCLEEAPAEVDRREGSLLYDALAPACARLAALYTELDTMLDRAFPDTAAGEDLDRKCAERGIARLEAAPAVRRGYFTGATPPLGARFSGGDLNFAVTLDEGEGACQLTAETAGAAGNSWFGTLLPIDHIAGLTAASLGEVLVPGEDEEDDESLRGRYFASFEEQAFGGNAADYRARVGELDGVGGVKAARTPAGGGTVGVCILGADWAPPSPELVEQVQQALDPGENPGAGVGLAPIGHTVTVTGARGVTVDVAFTLTLAPNVTWADVEQAVGEAIGAYFTDLARSWAASDCLTVRISQVETRVLDVAGVVDVEGTTLNGQAANLVLERDEVPLPGEVSHGAA